jgi:16S rRNA (adenine1518-N6/adenine1519-N6)-dimethyltransferase
MTDASESSPLSSLPPLKSVIAKYDLSPKKSLGQNFILDSLILDDIVRAAGPVTTGTTIEVGPGPGGLTRAILRAGASNVIVIEKDERCISALNEIKESLSASETNITIINSDALEIKTETLGTEPRRIIANLPYNIGAILLTSWLKHITSFSSLTLMFQKEVADRIVAIPGTRAYGRLSVMTSAFADASIKMILPPSVFTPAPKVTSALVHFTPKKDQPPVDFDTLETVAKTAFNQRRKMLRSSLKPLGDVAKICEATGIASDLRAENLSVADFIKIALFLKG